MITAAPLERANLAYAGNAAPESIPNRGNYFHRLLDRKSYFHQSLGRSDAGRHRLRVLNFTRGPGRCMAEWLARHPSADIAFDCIELDPAHMAPAERLNAPFRDRVTFTQENALRFRPAKQYDLIWASGIFDFCTDAIFTSLLRRLVAAVAPGGEVVIGNFAGPNPSRPSGELFEDEDGHLHQRTTGELKALARACGVPDGAVRVGTEPESVSLFLHITHP